MEMFSLSRIFCASTSYWRCTVLVTQTTVRPRSSNTGKPGGRLTTAVGGLWRGALLANLAVVFAMGGSFNEATLRKPGRSRLPVTKQVVLFRLILAQIIPYRKNAVLQ